MFWMLSSQFHPFSIDIRWHYHHYYRYWIDNESTSWLLRNCNQRETVRTGETKWKSSVPLHPTAQRLAETIIKSSDWTSEAQLQSWTTSKSSKLKQNNKPHTDTKLSIPRASKWSLRLCSEAFTTAKFAENVRKI